MKISVVCIGCPVYIYNTTSYQHAKLWKTLSTLRTSLALAKTREEATRFVPRKRNVGARFSWRRASSKKWSTRIQEKERKREREKERERGIEKANGFARPLPPVEKG